MIEIDETIGQISNLYRAVTGREAPATDAPYSPIPAEKDPVAFVQEQMDRLMGIMAQLQSVPQAAPTGAVHPMAGAATTPWFTMGLSGAPLGMAPGRKVAAWQPALAVWDSAKELLLCFDVPGILRDRIDVQIEGNVLIVSGERPSPVANGHHLRMAENAVGPFRRVMPLPLGLRTQEMTANLKDGVLEVRIPREPQTAQTPRRVPVS
jgi:HSP20 family molecular chaperone IbpA